MGGGIVWIAAVVVGLAGRGDASGTDPVPELASAMAAEEPADDAGTASPASTTTVAVDQRPSAPLTGLATDLDPSRPALAVKIDDSDPAAHPPIGVADADRVYVEMVEGGTTRMLAVFWSTDPALVGPVRSGRSTDAAILGELGEPLLAMSGANEVFLSQLASAPLVDLRWDAAPGAYDELDGVPSPYRLVADPATLRTAAAERGSAPPAALTWRDPSDVPAGTPLEAAEIRYSGGGRVVRWTWDPAASADAAEDAAAGAGGGVWRRSIGDRAHTDADGRALTAANVVVQRVPYVDTGLVDPAGSSVPEAELVGSGEVLVLTAGGAVEGTWSKASAAASTELFTTDGEPIALDPGTTWFELVPTSGDVARIATVGTGADADGALPNAGSEPLD